MWAEVLQPKPGQAKSDYPLGCRLIYVILISGLETEVWQWYVTRLSTVQQHVAVMLQVCVFHVFQVCVVHIYYDYG